MRCLYCQGQIPKPKGTSKCPLCGNKIFLNAWPNIFYPKNRKVEERRDYGVVVFSKDEEQPMRAIAWFWAEYDKGGTRISDLPYNRLFNFKGGFDNSFKLFLEFPEYFVWEFLKTLGTKIFGDDDEAWNFAKKYRLFPKERG